MIRTVVIINGRPLAGKDSAVHFMRDILDDRGFATATFSSIDPVRNMLTGVGIDLSAKSEQDRLLLSIVGDAVEAHNFYRTRACMQATVNLMNGQAKAVLFLHIREPLIINRYKANLEASGLHVTAKTCLVRSPRSLNVGSNPSDRNVHNMRYDDEIANTGTLDELKDACERFLYRQGLIDEMSLLH